MVILSLRAVRRGLAAATLLLTAFAPFRDARELSLDALTLTATIVPRTPADGWMDAFRGGQSRWEAAAVFGSGTVRFAHFGCDCPCGCACPCGPSPSLTVRPVASIAPQRVVATPPEHVALGPRAPVLAPPLRPPAGSPRA